MLYTLSDAKTFVARFVNTGGTCSNANLVTSRVNEAVRRLLQKADWKRTQQYMRITTFSDIATLPREVEAARLVDINCGPASIYSRAYEFLENGPGMDCQGRCSADLRDMGDGYSTFFDIPCFNDPDDEEVSETYRLFAVGNESPIAPLSMTIRGKLGDGSEILTNGLPGESLVIANWASGVEGTLSSLPTPTSTNVFASISSIHLPPGRTDYVSLYAVNQTTNHMFFLGKYHPDETVPSYRRYKIMGYTPDYVEKERCIFLYLLVKLRYLPASRDDDVLLIQNLDAIKNMVMAIRDENAGNLQQSIVYEQKAVALLSEQLADSDLGNGPEINFSPGYGYGEVARNFR